MANVVASLVGGSPRRLVANTVADVKQQMSLGSTYVSSVNGEPADDNTELNDEDFLSFSGAVKGGSL